MARKGFRVRKVIRTVTAPTERSHRMQKYDQLECGHFIPEREISSMGEAIHAISNILTGTPQKRHCHECVSGEKSWPEISEQWVKDQ